MHIRFLAYEHKASHADSRIYFCIEEGIVGLVSHIGGDEARVYGVDEFEVWRKLNHDSSVTLITQWDIADSDEQQVLSALQRHIVLDKDIEYNFDMYCALRGWKLEHGLWVNASGLPDYSADSKLGTWNAREPMSRLHDRSAEEELRRLRSCQSAHQLFLQWEAVLGEPLINKTIVDKVYDFLRSNCEFDVYSLQRDCWLTGAQAGAVVALLTQRGHAVSVGNDRYRFELCQR